MPTPGWTSTDSSLNVRVAADPSNVPIFINVRDRVTCLRQLVAWMEKAGQQRIILLDNDSSYPPLLEYLEASPHTVVRLGQNVGCRALWDMALEPNEPYVYTDPDVVPTEHCPLDLIAHLGEALERNPTFVKAGVGLYLEDVSTSMIAYEWERSLTAPSRLIAPGLYSSQIDTTLALQLPGQGFFYTAIRTGAPYEARHLPWYNLADPNEEDRYYLQRARTGSTGSMWATVLDDLA